jgi:Holliday junction DNA helicase RuvA
MIDRLTGTILSRGPTDVVIDVHGVGLHLEVSLATSDALSARAIGDRATLLCHLHILTNEPAVRLYGFATEEERRLFQMLLPIKGVGPSTALRILSSGGSTAGVVAAIASGDPKRIRAKGVGPKIAERVALELRDKLDGLASATASGIARPVRRGDSAADDAYLALRGLEFDDQEARELVEKVRARLPAASAEELVRESLRSAS